MNMANDNEFNELVKERFAKLPKVVQAAITSADVQKRMRALADTHKLHLDQWEALENEVHYTLLGIQPSEDLVANIKSEVGVTEEVAQALAADISKIVFEPIRQELERELGNESAMAEKTTDMENLRTQTLGKSPGQSVSPPTNPVPFSAVTPVTPQSEPTIPKSAPVIAATPPAPPPQGSAVRAAISEVYKAGESSAARKAVHDDPYREPPV